MAQSVLYVHIGIPKTGSTLLQRVATAKRDRLRNFGLLYPKSALRGYGHHDLAFLIDGGYPEWAKPQDQPLQALALALAEECAAADGNILLSSENFYLFPQPKGLHQLIAQCGLDRNRDVRIILYLRRQDELSLSWYNQRIKAQGYSGSIEQAIEESFALWDYEAQLARWAGVFGRDNLIVRKYEEASKLGHSLLHDFWSIACPEILAEIASEEQMRVNIGLNRDLLEIQKIINRLPISIVEKRGFHQELMMLTEQGGDFFSDAPLLTVAQRKSLLERYAESNDAVTKAYFNGDELFPHDDLCGGEPASRADLGQGEARSYGGLDQEKAIATLAWLLLRRQ